MELVPAGWPFRRAWGTGATVEECGATLSSESTDEELGAVILGCAGVSAGGMAMAHSGGSRCGGGARVAIQDGLGSAMRLMLR